MRLRRGAVRPFHKGGIYAKQKVTVVVDEQYPTNPGMILDSHASCYHYTLMVAGPTRALRIIQIVISTSEVNPHDFSTSAIINI